MSTLVPEEQEKMLKNTNYQRNVNQDYNEVSLHSGQNAIIKNLQTNKNLQTIKSGKRVEKQEPSYTLWEFRLVQSLWRTVWRFLKKLKTELPYDPAIPLLGIYPEKTKI